MSKKKNQSAADLAEPVTQMTIAETRYSPVKFIEVPTRSTLGCPRCGGTHLIVLDATMYERSYDRLSVEITHIGSGEPFVRQAARGGSGNPSLHGDAVTIQLGCFWCSRGAGQKILTLALFEVSGQIELAWLERDSDVSEMSDEH